MNKQTATSNRSALSRLIKTTFTAGLLPTLVFLFSVQTGHADSATWNLNPTNGNWYTAENWTPPTVPNGPLDTATFSHSEAKHIHLPAFTATTLDGIVYDAEAREFATSIEHDASLVFSGSGVTNNSTKTQTFNIFGGTGAGAGSISFLNNARSGTNMYYNLVNGIPAASVTFSNNSVSEGSLTNRGGQIDFFDNASQPGGLICFGAETVDDVPGIAIFHDHSVSYGVAADFGLNGGLPGAVYLNDDSICDGGYFYPQGGVIDLSGHNPPGLGCAGFAGYGVIYLGSNNLVVGKASADDAYAGSIVDGGSYGGSGGSLTKVGTGTLTLSGASTYTGGTTIKNGTLLITTRPGSGTGSGKVAVNTGTLGGLGKIGGVVTIGKGSGSGAFLSPGTSAIGTLTLNDTLTFKLDGTYQFELKSSNGAADQVIANGVTIRTGAQMSVADLGNETLGVGTIFTAILNTAATPISGNFANLADGSTLTVGSNTFQASYEGGDGNDLTLTVVP